LVDLKKINVNAETFIHETGHMLGLEDFYDTKGQTGGYGGADMQDNNFGDQCAFSKMSLGWIDPIVVTEELTVDLTSFTETGMFLLVKASKTQSNSMWAEYFLIEFVTATGLNKASYPTFFNTKEEALGVKISQVNASITDGSYKYSNSNKTNKLIRILEADYTTAFDIDKSYTSLQKLSDFYTPTSAKFGIDNYKSYKCVTTGEVVPFTMTVNSMNATKANVTVKIK